MRTRAVWLGATVLAVVAAAGAYNWRVLRPALARAEGAGRLRRSAALELARFGIRVNSIHPGVIDTPMLGRAPKADQVIKATPMRRMGTPDEIANVALFLASDESSYMTGAHVPVDGGVVA